MHVLGSMKSISSSSPPWMQSTGHTSTHDLSFTVMHGWQMTYVNGRASSDIQSVACKKHRPLLPPPETDLPRFVRRKPKTSRQHRRADDILDEVREHAQIGRAVV